MTSEFVGWSFEESQFDSDQMQEKFFPEASRRGLRATNHAFSRQRPAFLAFYLHKTYFIIIIIIISWSTAAFPNILNVFALNSCPQFSPTPYLLRVFCVSNYPINMSTLLGKVHPRTCHEGPEVEYKYSFTLALNGA